MKGKDPNSGPFKWVICSDEFSLKCDLIRKIAVIRTRCQVLNPGRNDMTAIAPLGFVTDIMLAGKRKLNKSKEPELAKWINLQDWSTCTLACGGGTQTLQRYCLKPPDALPCEGEPHIN